MIPVQKVHETPMNLKREMSLGVAVLHDFQKRYVFKNKRFLIPVQKVHESPMNLKLKMSLGVMVLHDFQKGYVILKSGVS